MRDETGSRVNGCIAPDAMFLSLHYCLSGNVVAVFVVPVAIVLIVNNVLPLRRISEVVLIAHNQMQRTFRGHTSLWGVSLY